MENPQFELYDGKLSKAFEHRLKQKQMESLHLVKRLLAVLARLKDGTKNIKESFHHAMPEPSNLLMSSLTIHPKLQPHEKLYLLLKSILIALRRSSSRLTKGLDRNVRKQSFNSLPFLENFATTSKTRSAYMMEFVSTKTCPEFAIKSWLSEYLDYERKPPTSHLKGNALSRKCIERLFLLSNQVRETAHVSKSLPSEHHFTERFRVLQTQLNSLAESMGFEKQSFSSSLFQLLKRFKSLHNSLRKPSEISPQTNFELSNTVERFSKCFHLGRYIMLEEEHSARYASFYQKCNILGKSPLNLPNTQAQRLSKARFQMMSYLFSIFVKKSLTIRPQLEYVKSLDLKKYNVSKRETSSEAAYLALNATLKGSRLSKLQKNQCPVVHFPSEMRLASPKIFAKNYLATKAILSRLMNRAAAKPAEYEPFGPKKCRMTQINDLIQVHFPRGTTMKIYLVTKKLLFEILNRRAPEIRSSLSLKGKIAELDGLIQAHFPKKPNMKIYLVLRELLRQIINRTTPEPRKALPIQHRSAETNALIQLYFPKRANMKIYFATRNILHQIMGRKMPALDTIMPIKCRAAQINDLIQSHLSMRPTMRTCIVMRRLLFEIMGRKIPQLPSSVPLTYKTAQINDLIQSHFPRSRFMESYLSVKGILFKAMGRKIPAFQPSISARRQATQIRDLLQSHFPRSRLMENYFVVKKIIFQIAHRREPKVPSHIPVTYKPARSRDLVQSQFSKNTNMKIYLVMRRALSQVMDKSMPKKLDHLSSIPLKYKPRDIKDLIQMHFPQRTSTAAFAAKCTENWQYLRNHINPEPQISFETITKKSLANYAIQMQRKSKDLEQELLDAYKIISDLIKSDIKVLGHYQQDFKPKGQPRSDSSEDSSLFDLTDRVRPRRHKVKKTRQTKESCYLT